MHTNQSIILTTAEAAQKLRLCPSTLAKLRLKGDGPVYCKLGRRVFYRPADLDAWLEANIRQSTSECDQKA